jgi:hypothetical protein
MPPIRGVVVIMKHVAWGLAFFAALFGVLVLLFDAQWGLFGRPRGIPREAVLLVGKFSIWEHCHLEANGQTVRCRTWNKDGLVREDLYLPYDEGPIPKASELTIDENGTGTAYAILLTNGRILLPESRFEELKAYWDRLCRDEPELLERHKPAWTRQTHQGER